MEFFKPGRTFDFMGQRKFWIPFSILLVLISTVLVFYPGPNYGTDFQGGTEVEVAFTKKVDAAVVREKVHAGGFEAPDVVEVQDKSAASRFIIRVREVTTLKDSDRAALSAALCLTDDPKKEPADKAACPESARATEIKFSAGGDKIMARYDSPPDLNKIREQVLTVSAKNSAIALRTGIDNPMETNKRDHKVEILLKSEGDRLLDGLRTSLGPDTVPEKALRVEWVGPKAGKQLRDSARNAVAIAIVFIMLYLAFRFDLRFAPGVVLACVHDAMVVLGVFVIFKREVTLSTIAAILTIIGYSMNDTVVVYDRIRENLSKHKGKTFAQIINLSVSETLSRTILTSCTVLLSVVAFLFWGTGVIKDFAIAMVIGVVAGTYSSIYVAAPLTEWIDSQLAKRNKKPGMAGVTGARA